MGSFDFEHCGCMQHFACFACRKAFKAGDEYVPDGAGGYRRRVVTCPECRQPMSPMGLLFRAPRRRAVRAWRRLEELARRSPRPPFEFPRRRPVPGACPRCDSPTGWDGKRCPYCGHIS